MYGPLLTLTVDNTAGVKAAVRGHLLLCDGREAPEGWGGLQRLPQDAEGRVSASNTDGMHFDTSVD